MPICKLRPCNYRGCNRLTRSSYCEEHAIIIEASRQENRKYIDRKYNRERRTRDLKEYLFYHSDEWRHIRQQALLRDNGMCQECKMLNKTIPAEEVHHKIPIKENFNVRLELDNLISLCKRCHNREHNR